MRGKRNASLATWMGFAGLAALLLVGSASARPRECFGNFTLTSEIHWGAATLPPGNYTFELDLTNDMITVKGQKRAAMVMSLEHHAKNHLESSALILVSRGGKRTVRALHLARLGVVLTYAVPRETNEELAKGPLVIEQVPIAVDGE